jgi:hypothetical protein
MPFSVKMLKKEYSASPCCSPHAELRCYAWGSDAGRQVQCNLRGVRQGIDPHFHSLSVLIVAVGSWSKRQLPLLCMAEHLTGHLTGPTGLTYD